MTLFSRVCTTAFLHDQKKLLKTHRAVLAARRTSQSFATWRHRHRRSRSPPSTLFPPIRRRRSRPFAADCRSLQQMTADEIERYSRNASRETMATDPDRGPLNGSSNNNDDASTLSNEGRGTMNESIATARATRSAHKHHSSSVASFPSYSSTRPSSIDAKGEMPPPPTPSEDNPTRSSRSTSTASRNTNRLSITLPIAPPSSDPSRPAPGSATSAHPSVPGTPVRGTPTSLASPADPNELIIAIAAQERRVMELREELGRAEGDLKNLRRQWTMHEGYKKHDRKISEATRPAAPQPEAWSSTPADDDLALHRSVEADRRKLLLQTQGTPRDERKRVFSGRHARTLSLLSPTKPSGEPFAVHEDRDAPRSIPDPEHRPAAAVRRQAALNKRATWQPQQFSQHAHSTSLNAHLQSPMTQIVEDFKLGFRTFYEDIRQITVGDEPVNGAAAAGAPGSRSAAAPGATASGQQRTYAADDQDTIRPSSTARPKLAAAFEYPDVETPSKAPRAGNSSAAAAPQRERNARARNKHFSWTPLSFEGIDGDAWLTFDSPASAGKSTRWSGSTMNEEGEEKQEVESPLNKKTQPPSGPLSPQRLEELTATVVNRLSPSNIKRTASEYVTQWEQSMADVAVEGKEPRGQAEGKEVKEGDAEGEGKENAALVA